MQIPDEENDELPSEDPQKTRLADNDFENYAFLLMAIVAKEVEEQNECNDDKFDWSIALMGLTFLSVTSSCPLFVQRKPMQLRMSLLPHIHQKTI